MNGYAHMVLEGIVAKQVNSLYTCGIRSPDWLKIKFWKEDIFQVYGALQGEGSCAGSFGSLILSKNDVYVGNVGSGFTEKQRADFLTQLSAIKTGATALKDFTPDKAVLMLCEPRIKVEVRYLEYGTDGHLRFPSFRRWNV